MSTDYGIKVNNFKLDEKNQCKKSCNWDFIKHYKVVLIRLET